MPQPTMSGVHIDAALTNFSLAYIQDDMNFVANKVFPVVPVDHKTDSYWTFTKEDWFRDEAQIRPPSTESAGSGYNLSNTTYSCDVWAIHKDIADQERYNADSAIDLERGAVKFVTQRMLLRHEIEWTSTFFTTSVWTTDATPTNLWSNYATSSPMTDIETGALTIQSTTGFRPNTLVLGAQVYSQLINHPDLIDRIKYTSSDAITKEIMARYFGVERVFVTGAIKNTANEGAAASYSFVQGKHALLAYVDPDVQPESATAGVTFAWNGVSDGMGESVGVVRIEMPLKRAVRIESQQAWDSKVIATDLGYFFNGAVA